MDRPLPGILAGTARPIRPVPRRGWYLSEKQLDADLDKTIQVFAGPGKMADVRKIDFFWFILMDSIHHRGQFSVYLRMAGGKVPAIYGPSADEKWS